MKTTAKTRRSFNAAVREILTTDRETWPEPVIYADEIDGEMIFDACNKPALHDSAIVWMHVEPDSFGELTGNAEQDADGIEANSFEQAVEDIEQAVEGY